MERSIADRAEWRTVTPALCDTWRPIDVYDMRSMLSKVSLIFFLNIIKIISKCNYNVSFQFKIKSFHLITVSLTCKIDFRYRS